VFNTVRDAVREAGAEASMIYVPAHLQRILFWKRRMPGSR